MEALTGRARAADTYMAGLGASGALIVGAVVVFLLLVGLVTFDAFPRAAGLLSGERGAGGGADVSAPADAAVTVLAPSADLVADAGPASLGPAEGGAGGGDGGGTGGTGGGAPTPGDGGSGGGPGTGGGTGSPEGGSAPAGGGGGTGGGGGATGTVNDTVGGLANTVNETVDVVDNTVNETVNGVGGALGGLTGGEEP